MVDHSSKSVSRRTFIAGLGAAASLPLFGDAPAWARLRMVPAQQAQAPTTSLLPINTPKIDHLDVIVPDVAAAARFYMGVFNTKLHAQPFQGGQRYFVLFGELPAGREVGYLAIGDSRGRGTYIGHFCTSIFNYRQNSAAITSALVEAVDKAGLGKLTMGSGPAGLFSDPDGIEIQFLPAPDTLVTAAVPSDLVEPNNGLVTPRGVDHVLLHVADLEKGAQFYRILYGKEASRSSNPTRIWFQIGDTRLGLEQVQPGQKPHIEHFAVKVASFNRNAVIAGLQKLGAEIVASPDESGVVRFRDLNGISVELKGA
jgi:catechol 2,3-dioxygenase-like lactoylglutathione lyase family enzyme